MADDDLDGLDDDMAEKVERIIAKREADRERAAARAKPPKDGNEFHARIKDAVREAFDDLLTERQSAAESADEQPARAGRSRNSFADWWNGRTDDGDDDA